MMKIAYPVRLPDTLTATVSPELRRCRRRISSLARHSRNTDSRGVGRALIGAPLQRGWTAVNALQNPASDKKMKTKNITTLHWFAAIFGYGLILITLGTASAQQPLRPALILDVDAPQEVDAQPNLVMAQPHAPIAIPFRSTMGE